MKNLRKLVCQSTEQEIINPAISSSFSDNLKANFLKVGMAVVLTACALGGTTAHAADNTLKTMIGLSAVGGVAMNNEKPAEGVPVECRNLPGASGLAIGGAMAGGALAGNQIGKGHGKQIATVVGGLFAGAFTAGYQAQKFQEDCARLQQNNARYSNSYYNNQNANPNPEPLEPVLYQYVDAQGRSGFVTLRESPGLNGLMGNRRGAYSVDSQPVIKNAVEGTLNALNFDYRDLEEKSDAYLRLVNGQGNPADRYPTSNDDLQRVGRNYQGQMKQVLQEFEKSYNTYAKDRGIAAKILDNAVTMDNMDIAQYRNSGHLFVPPTQAKLTYNSAYHQDLPNRYATGLAK
jgi:uncharacterized protein YcfJ